MSISNQEIQHLSTSKRKMSVSSKSQNAPLDTPSYTPLDTPPVYDDTDDEHLSATMKKKNRSRNRKTFECVICMDKFTNGHGVICANGHISGCVSCYIKDQNSGRKNAIQHSGGRCGICRGAIHDQDQNDYVMDRKITDSWLEISQSSLFKNPKDYKNFYKNNYNINKKLVDYFTRDENTSRWITETGMTEWGFTNRYWELVYSFNLEIITDFNKTSTRLFNMNKDEGRLYIKKLIEFSWDEGIKSSRLWVEHQHQ